MTTRTPVWFTAALAVPASDESVTVAGARIAYRTWGEAGRPGVVLVHGTAAHAHWWDHIAPFLAEDGLRVAALSISGHGDSDWRDQYGFDQWAAEVMAVAAAAGIAGSPAVIGHSLGGHIALNAARVYGPALDGIVVIDAPMFDSPPPLLAEAQSDTGFGSGRPGRTYPTREAVLDRFRLVPEQEVLPYVREHVAGWSVTLKEDGGWGWKFDQTLFAKMIPHTRFPGYVTDPVKGRGAFLCAQHGLMSPPLAARLARTFDEPAPVVVLPAAGHHVLLDEPIALVAALRTVLAAWAVQELDLGFIRLEAAMLRTVGPPAPETLRRDQLARRQRIVRSALRALADGDYEQVKVNEVARDSGVALGTLYRYFASKEHLFAAVFLEWQGALQKKLEKEPPAGGTEADRLRDVIHRTIRAFQLQPQFYRVLMVLNVTTDPYAADLYGSLSQEFRASVQTAFADAYDEDRESVLRVVNAVLNESLRAWVMNRTTIADVYAHVDDAIRLIYEYRPSR